MELEVAFAGGTSSTRYSCSSSSAQFHRAVLNKGIHTPSLARPMFPGFPRGDNAAVTGDTHAFSCAQNVHPAHGVLGRHASPRLHRRPRLRLRLVLHHVAQRHARGAPRSRQGRGRVGGWGRPHAQRETRGVGVWAAVGARTRRGKPGAWACGRPEAQRKTRSVGGFGRRLSSPAPSATIQAHGISSACVSQTGVRAGQRRADVVAGAGCQVVDKGAPAARGRPVLPIISSGGRTGTRRVRRKSVLASTLNV